MSAPPSHSSLTSRRRPSHPALAPGETPCTLAGRLSPRPPARHRLSPFARQLRRSDGFTIVEVMMASVILVVGFMGMITAITLGSEMTATARRQTIASQIITHETEKLRLQSWSYINGTLASSGATTYSSDSPELSTAITNSGVSFNLAVSVATVATNLREVTFTVSWTKSGTTTAANTAGGSWLEKIAFYRPTAIARSYTRVGVAYFTKYGLNMNAQRQ